MRVLEAERASARVGIAGVQDNRDELPAFDDLLRPGHRRSLDAIAGEDAGASTKRPVVHHHRNVSAATRLDSGGDSCGPKALGCGHAHGATPATGSAVSSASPSAMFAFCRAWPAAPFVRLSSADTTTTRPACSSSATWMCTEFDPSVAPVCGH